MGGWGANCHLLLAPFERTIWRYREDFVNIDISEGRFGPTVCTCQCHCQWQSLVTAKILAQLPLSFQSNEGIRGAEDLVYAFCFLFCNKAPPNHSPLDRAFTA